MEKLGREMVCETELVTCGEGISTPSCTFNQTSKISVNFEMFIF